MTAAFVALSMSLAIHATRNIKRPSRFPIITPTRRNPPRRRARYILPPGPGDGWGYPNNSPDAYGWDHYGPYLPLSGDRTAEYYFPRYFAVPPEQMFLQTYYNPYETRGQRYLPFAAGGRFRV